MEVCCCSLEKKFANSDDLVKLFIDEQSVYYLEFLAGKIWVSLGFTDCLHLFSTYFYSFVVDTYIICEFESRKTLGLWMFFLTGLEIFHNA